MRLEEWVEEERVEEAEPAGLRMGLKKVKEVEVEEWVEEERVEEAEPAGLRMGLLRVEEAAEREGR